MTRILLCKIMSQYPYRIGSFFPQSTQLKIRQLMLNILDRRNVITKDGGKLIKHLITFHVRSNNLVFIKLCKSRTSWLNLWVYFLQMIKWRFPREPIPASLDRGIWGCGYLQLSFNPIPARLGYLQNVKFRKVKSF